MSDTLEPDDYLNCQWIAHEELIPNSYNPNSTTDRERELLKRSIVNHGWTMPVIVHAEDLYIIDGEQRWTVAMDEEIATNKDLTPDGVPANHIPVFGVTLDENEARVATIQHNRARGEIDLDQMDSYADEFDPDGLQDIGLTEDEVLGIADLDIDEDTEPDIDPDELPDETDPEVLNVDADNPSNDIPTPDGGELSVVCSPSERNFIEAVLHDGETLDEYMAVLVNSGLIDDLQDLIDQH